MTDKVQRIKEWISKTQDGLMDDNGNFEYPEHEGAYHILCNLDAYIDSLQEEPVSIDFEQELYKAFGQVKDFTLGMRIAKWFYDMGQNSHEPVSEELEDFALQYAGHHAPYDDCMQEVVDAVKAGAEWQSSNFWKDAQGDDLPEIDNEVIVLTQKYPLKGSEYAISFAHRPYKGKYIGKSLTTGNIETFENKTYGKGGWNIPDVKWWLDCGWPNEEE